MTLCYNNKHHKQTQLQLNVAINLVELTFVAEIEEDCTKAKIINTLVII